MINEKKKKLRIGLLMDSFDLPLWEYLLINRLIQSNYATIELLVVKDIEGKNRKLLERIMDKGNWKMFLFYIYRYLDELFYKPNPYVFDRKDTSELLKNIHQIMVQTISNSFSDRFRSEDIKRIRQYNLDVLIRFGFKILRGDILNTPKYGIWSYHHGDNKVNRGGYAGFWEVVERKYVTGTILQILTEDLDNGIILYRSLSSTKYSSYARNINNYYSKSISFLPRKLKELYNMGEIKFFDKVKRYNIYPTYYSEKLYSSRNINNRLIIKLLISQLMLRLKSRLISLFYFNQWILLFNIKKGYSDSFWRYKKIIPPKDRFWADPFVIYKDNKYYIFVEEYIYKLKKAHISCIIMNSKGSYNKPIKILDKPYHISYPFIFESDDKLYMIPETRDAETIELYKCTDFPLKWEFEMILMENIKAVDTTLFQYENKYWLFTNILENEGASTEDELFLFYSDHFLTNDWKAHPLNPIVSDVTKARPAGNIFIRNSIIYRPSQDCSKRYGYGIKINNIITLNETSYEEKEIASIEPNWESRLLGTHTYNKSGNLNIIDALLRRRKYF